MGEAAEVGPDSRNLRVVSPCAGSSHRRRKGWCRGDLVLDTFDLRCLGAMEVRMNPGERDQGLSPLHVPPPRPKSPLQHRCL